MRRMLGIPVIRWTLLGALAVILAGCAYAGWGWQGAAAPREFRSNGERIYFTATSERGTPITADMGMGMMGGGMMGGGTMSCVNCHGPDGRGGRVRMMMRTFVAPDIRYKTLTEEKMEHEGEEEHPPYTDETIKRAITQGVDPAGEPLEWPMPRWSMSDEDLEDLLDYLKSLE
ncbi:MAG TPA: cytochrome c [Caldilineae bacterium]|nr:cytochrome c [Caldilineae bacterium]